MRNSEDKRGKDSRKAKEKESTRRGKIRREERKGKNDGSNKEIALNNIKKARKKKRKHEAIE